MRSLFPLLSDARRTPSQVGAVALALSLMLIGATGCEEQAATAPPKIVADSPEAELEVVMQRLDEAIDVAAAAEGSGVVSQRRSSYRVIPPGQGGDNYRAEVTIRTDVSLARTAVPANQLKKPPTEKPNPFKVEEPEGEEAAEGGPEPTGPGAEEEPGEEAVEEPPASSSARRAIAESRKTMTRKYELVYENNRWTLPQKPADDDDVGRYLFEYALSGQ